jgi:hypothetical protein
VRRGGSRETRQSILGEMQSSARVRTFELKERGEETEFSMTEVYSGLLAGLITRSIPDMTESFEQFADGLKRAAESAS